jgi:8-hydroxy-5-deazaflavin:NADPH oxidoreductase
MRAGTGRLSGGVTTIGIIGSGNIGGTVARLAVAAGYDVVVSNSRGPDTLADLVAELGPRARAATAAEAAAAADVVVTSVPFKAFGDLPAGPLAGKVVLDTGNYYTQRDGTFADIDAGTVTSATLVQRHLADSHVVKAFNNIYWGHLAELARPAGAPDRTTLTIAGDDAEAKRTATEFIDALGYDVLDIGTLADSWRVEPDHPAYGGQYGTYGGPATPADTETVRAAVAKATR